MTMNPPSIPWHIIGPAGALAVIILLIVFGFLLKYQSKKSSNSCAPKDLNTVNKNSLCFNHEGRISANEATTNAIEKELGKMYKSNREDHGKIFDKMENLGKEIITAINNKNPGGYPGS